VAQHTREQRNQGANLTRCLVAERLPQPINQIGFYNIVLDSGDHWLFLLGAAHLSSLSHAVFGSIDLLRFGSFFYCVGSGRWLGI
jgi:hypothetical protein